MNSMIGAIVEFKDKNEKSGLFVVVKFDNREDAGSCSYDRDYLLVPYQPKVDDMKVCLEDALSVKVSGIYFPFTFREDKKCYQQYGYSNIRGNEIIYLERTWEEVIIPSR